MQRRKKYVFGILLLCCTLILSFFSGCAASSNMEIEPEEPAPSAYADNFAVDSAAAAAFAGNVQEAVAAKDLEKLADLIAFPVYVGFPEDGGVIESREEFLALESDKVFTPELVESVAAANTDQLTPSMAGFVLSDGSTANVIFGVQEGQLTITGINY